MTTIRQTEPWRELPRSVAGVIEPEIPATTRDILEAIGREVPEYARPIEGAFGRGLMAGVDEALNQFVALVRDPEAGRERGRGVYMGLGRGELRQGRTLDSLQSAYRVGARAAWRHLAAAGRQAGLEPEVLNTLAEAIFAYIDELSADSVEGYTEAASEQAGVRQRRRRELAALLLRDPPASTEDVRAAARAAGWKLPEALAPLACDEANLDRIAPRLSAEALATSADGAGCAILDAASSDLGELAQAVGDADAAVGPAVPPEELAQSWSLALAALAGRAAGRVEGTGVVAAADVLPGLLLSESPAVASALVARRLGALDPLTPKARERMRETALAYVRHRGNAAEMARAMHVHPQTARYRLARLRELLGDQLDDPDARFELELALRASG